VLPIKSSKLLKFLVFVTFLAEIEKLSYER